MAIRLDSLSPAMLRHHFNQYNDVSTAGFITITSGMDPWNSQLEVKIPKLNSQLEVKIPKLNPQLEKKTGKLRPCPLSSQLGKAA